MEMEAGSSFEGWAHIELYGHNREDGYVTTQYFGSACMFLVSVPEIPNRVEELKRPMWVGDAYMPAGTKVEFEEVPSRKRYLGPGAIYALNPTTEEEVLQVIIRQGSPKVIAVVALPPGGPQLNNAAAYRARPRIASQ